MKKTIATFTLLIAAAMWAAMPSSFTFRIIWAAQQFPGSLTNYVDKTNCAFNIYGTTNLGTPQSQWPRILCFTNWTLGPTLPNNQQWYTSSFVTLPPGQYFITLALSNSNGETIQSNTDNNSPWLSPASTLELK